MVQLVSSFSQVAQQYMPSQHQVVDKFSTTLPKVARFVNEMAVPIMALLLLSNIQGAGGTPAAYAACCAACGTVTGATTAGVLLPLSVGACIKACLPIFFAPFP